MTEGEKERVCDEQSDSGTFGTHSANEVVALLYRGLAGFGSDRARRRKEHYFRIA